MGVIREEGGKMYMGDGSWDLAYNEFYEGFLAYQEAGNTRAKSCLAYVVLANMLALSDINPFDAREAKAYAEETEIAAMRNLRSAYDANDLDAFERTLRDRRAKILDDPFIMSYLAPLRRRMREQVLLNLLKPYRRVKLAFVAARLALDVDAVEAVLVDMILDDRVKGRIDMLQGHLVLDDGAGADSDDKTFAALDSWSAALDALAANAANRVQ